MLKIIKEYQRKYIEIINEFKKQTNKTLEEYYLIFDKIELLYKRNKKTIFNYLENRKEFVYYGGATYFNKKRGEIYPAILAKKRLIVADPILKLSIFLREPRFVNEDRIKEIIDRAIEKTIEIKEELEECYIIYINPDEFLNEIKEGIQTIAEDLTLQYLNNNLNINYKSIEEFIDNYKDYNYELLDREFPMLNDLVATVNAEQTDSLEEKIHKNFFYSGIKVEGISDIKKIIITLMGLFGQAFELKSVSLCLNVPLYINRPNVLMYVNFINRINDDDKNNLFETNLLYAVFIFFREYKFQKQYEDIIKYANENKIYDCLKKMCKKEKFSIKEYLEIIDKVINEKDNIERPFTKI